METKDAQLRLYKWIAGSITIAVLLTLFILFLRRQIRKKRQELALATQENDQLHTQIQEKTETIEGLNQLVDTNNQKMLLLNEQIAEKSHMIEELNHMINENAADMQLITQLQQSVALLKERLETHQKEKEVHSRTHDLNTLLQHPTVKRFMEMGDKREDQPTYSDWHALYPLVEEYFPKLAVFRNDISDAEYQICVLIKLGCRLSDIAHLTNLNNNNLCVMRTRLLTKLFHTKVGGTSMFDKLIKEL